MAPSMTRRNLQVGIKNFEVGTYLFLEMDFRRWKRKESKCTFGASRTEQSPTETLILTHSYLSQLLTTEL
jgi:hypothetical protein